MDCISLDVAIEIDSHSKHNYETEYNTYATTKGLKQNIIEIFKQQSHPSVLNAHKHIRVFFQKEQENWSSELAYISVSDSFLEKIRKLNHTTYDIKFCVCVQNPNGENSFFLIPKEVEYYIIHRLMENIYQGFMDNNQELCTKFVTIMLQMEKPNDNGIDVCSTHL